MTRAIEITQPKIGIAASFGNVCKSNMVPTAVRKKPLKTKANLSPPNNTSSSMIPEPSETPEKIIAQTEPELKSVSDLLKEAEEIARGQKELFSFFLS